MAKTKAVRLPKFPVVITVTREPDGDDTFLCVQDSAIAALRNGEAHEPVVIAQYKLVRTAKMAYGPVRCLAEKLHR
jgi:hypothetical protein